MIRSVHVNDAKELAEIYNYYILYSTATFEETPIDGQEMKHRIQSIASKYPWIVYEEQGKIIAYAYANEWKSRSAYKRTVESSVYVKQGEMSKGVGAQLYKELIQQLTDLGFHAVLGGITVPNPESIRFHEKFGFEKVGHLKQVGYKFEQWVDVGYWELIIGDTILGE